MNIEVNKKILSSFSVIIIVISGTHPKIYSSYKISLKLINIYFSCLVKPTKLRIQSPFIIKDSPPPSNNIYINISSFLRLRVKSKYFCC